MKTKTKHVSLSSKIDALSKAIDLQAETFKSILNEIVLPLNQEKGNRLNNRIDRKTVHKTREEVKEKKINAGDVFIEALKKIGRPVTTGEMAKRMFKFNPSFSKLAKNKKQFMQLLYTNASQLSKSGLINRTPISTRIFEYSLNEFGKSNKNDTDNNTDNDNDNDLQFIKN